MEIKPIRNERDHERALRRVEELWNSPEGWRALPQSDEKGILVTLIDAYEESIYTIDLADPIEAIKFRLEQQDKDTRALIGVIGRRTRVHVALNGKRSLSLKMIRNLHDEFGIPVNVLIQLAQKMGKRSRRHRSRAVTNRLLRPRKSI
jgi:HTH-type transcriptional regulator / antitoxin HigA